jgi:uncharacterized protein YndB with AHSA1/START domain
MITIILVVLAVLIAAVLLVAASKPNTFRIQRATDIKAPRESIFPLINDLRRHQSWSPFDQNPSLKRAHSGAETGTGAVYEWEGDRKAGAGRLAITESTPASKITMALDMLRPFRCHNIVEFSLEPKGETTYVTWQMHGPQPFIAKLMSTFVDCEKMVGKQFEAGLGSLKSLAERS